MEQKIRKQRSGFTLIEMVISIGIVGLLSAIAMPSYQDHINKVNIAMMMVDIARIQGAVENYYVNEFIYAPDLATIAMDELTDAYGKPYNYLLFLPSTPSSEKRKDKNLNPINPDYDLYSIGKDGETSRILGSSKALDDIVRANDGAYLGLAADF